MVNQAMRSSIGQLPQCNLVPVGAVVRDAYSDAEVPASEALPHVCQTNLGAPDATARPSPALSREDAMSRLGLHGTTLSAAPTTQVMPRPARTCPALNVARERIDEVKRDIDATLNGAEIPSAFVRKQQKKTDKTARNAAMTCGASYLCNKADKSDSSAAMCVYCLGGALIGSIACPIFAGPIMIDLCCCGGLFTACTVGCLGCCGQACAGDVKEDRIKQAYAHELLSAWSRSSRSSAFSLDRAAEQAVFYKKDRDVRLGAGGAYIITLRPEVIEHQEAYLEALSELAEWCAAKNLSDEACRLVRNHLNNVHRGSNYRAESTWAF